MMSAEILENVFPMGIKNLEDKYTFIEKRALGLLGVSIYIPKAEHGYSREEAEYIGKRILRGLPADGVKGRIKILEDITSYIIFMEFSLENLAECLDKTE